MFLTISGKPSKVSTKTVRAAIAFYADYLMFDHDEVDVYLDFERGFAKNQKVEADCVNDDGNDFTVTVDADMGERKTLIALAHEMVHVKQFAQDDFAFNERRRTFRFGGKSYPEDMNYWEKPWEIEAFGRETGLYIMFKQSQKKAK